MHVPNPHDHNYRTTILYVYIDRGDSGRQVHYGTLNLCKLTVQHSSLVQTLMTCVQCGLPRISVLI